MLIIVIAMVRAVDVANVTEAINATNAMKLTSETICTENICDYVKCKEILHKDCDKGTVYQADGGFCGCCPACIKVLDEGAICEFNVKGGLKPDFMCMPPLVCITHCPKLPRKCTNPFQYPPIIAPIEPTNSTNSTNM